MEGQARRPAGSEDAKDDRTPSPLPPGRDNHETYIVQFPKDQVYRVPPSENALIMERHRNPPNGRKRPHGCPRLLLTIFLILVSIVAVVGITLATLYFIFHPTGPAFSVTNVVVKNPARPAGIKNSQPQYEIWLTAKNPNHRVGLEYKKDGEISLLYDKTRVVATGKFPTLEQQRDASTDVKVELTGSDGPLPRAMEKSMDDTESNTPIALDLDMKIRVRIKAAGMETWAMKSNVVCNVKVNNLKNDTRVLSQECDTDFKQKIF